MGVDMQPYTRYDPNRRDSSLWFEPQRIENAPELYQICEGVLGYSNVIDLYEPPTIIVHPRVCNINSYKPFIEHHTGLVIVLEEDHELGETLFHFDSLKRFTDLPNGIRLSNFIYIPTKNNDPMPMWGIAEYACGITAGEKVNELRTTSWPRFAQFIHGLRAGKNVHFQIKNYNPAIQSQSVRLAGGYWPEGCAGATKGELEFYGINVEPIEELMYRAGGR